MKKLVAITIVLALLACVLPMAQARQDSPSDTPSTGSEATEDIPVASSGASESKRELSQKQEGLLKAIEDLYAQLQQLESQKLKLQAEIRAMSHAEHLANDQAHQAKEHAAHAELKAKEAKVKAAKASAKAKEAKDKAAKVKTKAQTEHWQQWAKQMQQWAKGHEKWAESEEFKQWQKDLQQWAQNLARFQASVLRGSGGPAPEPGPMPVMPTMPPMPTSVVAPVLPIVGPAEVAQSGGLTVQRSTGKTTSPAPTLPGETASTGRSGRDIEIKKDKDGKYVATTQMQFVSKVKSGAPFVIRNNVGRIVLRPSKDGKCDVRAVIRGKAGTSDEARAKVEQVGMSVNSSEERYYLKPITRDGDQWDDLNVDLFITVPPGIEPDLETKMGSIELYHFEGKIKAVTNMGAIKSVNTTGDLELLTKMGSIEFLAPRDLSAKFSIRTKMGSIKSDLPMEIVQSYNMFHKGSQGTVGTGQANISLTTDMGSISLKWYSPSQDATMY